MHFRGILASWRTSGREKGQWEGEVGAFKSVCRKLVAFSEVRAPRCALLSEFGIARMRRPPAGFGLSAFLLGRALSWSSLGLLCRRDCTSFVLVTRLWARVVRLVHEDVTPIWELECNRGS